MRALVLVILVTAALQAGCAKPSQWWEAATPGTVYRHAPGADFASRCQAAGVLRCFGFDADADFNIGVGGGNGAWGQNYGIFPPWGTSDYSRIVRDTTIATSGASSMKMIVPSNVGSDVSGAWFTNFSTDLQTRIGNGETVYIQWRQRFDTNFITTQYRGRGQLGNKLVIISAGDIPGVCNPSSPSTVGCPGSCTDIEVVASAQMPDKNKVIRVYNSCVTFSGFEYVDRALRNVTVQNAVGCLYPNYPSPPCARIYANEWMTFKIRLTIGTFNSPNSTMQMWVGREGQASVKILDFSPATGHPWKAFRNDNTHEYGKIWLTPYMTNKDRSQTTEVANTWYDELIISTQDIADP